jgi:hypothetical protein
VMAQPAFASRSMRRGSISVSFHQKAIVGESEPREAQATGGRAVAGLQPGMCRPKGRRYIRIRTLPGRRSTSE